MFARFARPFWKNIFTPRKIFTTTAILAYSIFKTKTLLDSVVVEQSAGNQQEAFTSQTPINIGDYIKNLQEVEVCDGKLLNEGERKVVVVKDYEGKPKKIIVLRAKGKLFAFSGNCPHRDPLDDQNTENSLQNAVCFNDKLFCPHHGCIFDIKSGSIQHGPALNNLPIFFSEEKNGKVKLLYPLAVPSSVAPSSVQRDVQDLRKVVILGGDDSATIGCINGLRQFGFQGQVTVVKQGKLYPPYKKQHLHKAVINLHLNDSPKQQQKQNNKKTNKSKQQVKTAEQIQKQVEELIHNQLDQKIYKKLSYYSEEWYDYYGVDFIYNQQSYRIINKQYYPYITFSDGTKLEFDALLVATGVVQKIPTYQSITIQQKKDLDINLSQNVFCPLRSKQQHEKLLTFLNVNKVKSVLVMGYNIQSLEFIQAFNKQFPEVNVNVIDGERDSAISQVFGPDVQKNIIKQFTQRGVNFFIKVKDQIFFSNKYSEKNINKRLQEQQKNKKGKNKSKNKQVDNSKTKYNDSITVRLSDDLRLKADCVVIFPQQFAGNTEWVKNGKYTDFDFFHQNRLSGDTFGRTDNIRVFSAGMGACNDYYLLNKRLVSSSSHVSYQQGYNVALNMQALRIPFSYVPFEYYNFFDKKLLYVGTKEFYDSVLVIGSVQQWNFVAIYASGSKVKAVSGSPSKSRQISILRQAFRVNCMPMFEEFVSGYWSIQNLETLVKKLNKSGCYRDLIFQNRQNIHRKDLVWMERTPDAGFQNDRPVMSEEYPSVEVGQNGVLKEL